MLHFHDWKHEKSQYRYHSIIKFHSNHIIYYRIVVSCYEYVTLIVYDLFNSKSAQETYGCLNERPPSIDIRFLYRFLFDVWSYFFHETFGYSIFVNSPIFAIKLWCMHYVFKYSVPSMYPMPRWHMMYNMPLLLSMVSGFTILLTRILIKHLAHHLNHQSMYW